MQHCTPMERNQEGDDELVRITEKLGEILTLESSSSINHDDNLPVMIHRNDDDDEDGDEDEDEEFEFSFFGGEKIESPVSAEEAFHNGQIRPIFPFADEDAESSGDASSATPYIPPVKAVYVAEGPYCVWSKVESTLSENSTPAVTPEMKRKSNSTGFSRLWKMKDIMIRSNSDGKDTFVFLSKKKVNLERNSERKVTTSSLSTNVGGEKKGKAKKVVVTESVAAYEALYGKKKGGRNGKSYLPYRQDLVGLFTNVNGLSRNLHPY